MLLKKHLKLNSMEKIDYTEKRITKPENSYWNNTGAYQDEHDKLYAQLVPSSDNASTIHGELIRCANRLSYDYYNNGNCNAVEDKMEDCSECDGSGWEEEQDCGCCDGDGEVYNMQGDGYEECEDCMGTGKEEEQDDCHWCGGDCQVFEKKEITPFFEHRIDYLDAYLDETIYVDNIKEFLLCDDKGYKKYKFDEEEEKVYVELMDAVMHQVLTTKNETNIQYKPQNK